MGLLKPAENMTAFAKIGALGFTGSGKTHTASLIAIGLAKLEKAKGVAFFDTEKSSDWVKKTIFDPARVPLVVHRGRAFVDLLAVMKEAEEAKFPLIIDSISHVWQELMAAHLAKSKRKSMTMYDWGIVKGQWKDFTDLYINSSCHIIMLGRAGYEYEQQLNEGSGKMESVKAGTKMKVEGETGFEPDLLLEMERVDMGERGIINRCFVLKDRSNTINGKTFDMPSFATFKPFFDCINIGGRHFGVDTTRTSQELFDSPDYSYEERQKRRDILVEELQALLIKAGLDGTSTEAKKGRVEKLEGIFGTSAKTAIENMELKTLSRCVAELKKDLFPPPVEPPPLPPVAAAMIAGFKEAERASLQEKGSA